MNRQEEKELSDIIINWKQYLLLHKLKHNSNIPADFTFMHIPEKTNE